MDRLQALSYPLTDLLAGEDRLMADQRSSRKVLADNVNALMKERIDLDSNPKVSNRTSLGTGTIARIRNSETAASVDTIDALARAFEIEPWQLMAPNLGNLPSLRPITKEEREAYDKLRAQIQGQNS